MSMPILTKLILWIWPIFWIYWVIAAFGSKRNIGSALIRFSGFRLIIFVVVIVVFHFSLLPDSSLGNNHLTNNTGIIVDIGFVLFLAGLLLALWARLYLGKNWGMPMTKKQSPELVTSGPYRFIRHPIYTGVLCAILGTALATNLDWLAVLVLVGAYFIYSATVEERNMTEEFPKAYPDYKKKTKMLLPFIL
jgi:protein-S-isoprenylcysteine O-methyltransferase Ste14